MMKYGYVLAVMAALLVGTSSGGFVNGPVDIDAPGWAGFESGYISKCLSPFGEYKEINLADWLKPPVVNETDELEPEFEPVPFVMPQPLSISKEELFSSFTTVSKNKMSLLSSYKSTKSYS